MNPSRTYKQIAASAQRSVRSLIEDRNGPAGDLKIRSFIQGSYGRETAIHTIDDVDVVALCSVSYKPRAGRNTRDQLFDLVGGAIRGGKLYSHSVRHGPDSMCVKVELKQIKVEVLPALRSPGAAFANEPFYIFRPHQDRGEWGQAFARTHQALCTKKNVRCDGNFVPMVKVIKHLRSLSASLGSGNACSFHIECLLHTLKDSVFSGGAAECIQRVLKALAGFTPEDAGHSRMRTPSREALLFGEREWSLSGYSAFHGEVKLWHQLASKAVGSQEKWNAIKAWQVLLGDQYFPGEPT